MTTSRLCAATRRRRWWPGRRPSARRPVRRARRRRRREPLAPGGTLLLARLPIRSSQVRRTLHRTLETLAPVTPYYFESTSATAAPGRTKTCISYSPTPPPQNSRTPCSSTPTARRRRERTLSPLRRSSCRSATSTSPRLRLGSSRSSTRSPRTSESPSPGTSPLRSTRRRRPEPQHFGGVVRTTGLRGGVTLRVTWCRGTRCPPFGGGQDPESVRWLRPPAAAGWVCGQTAHIHQSPQGEQP